MNKKDSILQATLELVVENGIQNTPLSAITKKADVGMGTVYNYFKTKEDIIRELYLKIKMDGSFFILDGYDSSLHIKQRYFSIFENVFNFYLNKPLEFLFMEQLKYSPIIGSETKSKATEYMLELKNLFEDGQKQGIFKTTDIEQQMYFIYGAISSLIGMHIMKTTKMNSVSMSFAIKASWDAIKE